MQSDEMIRAADANRALLAQALARVAQADRDAMRQVYDMTSAKLFGICLRICRDRDIAADVLQETYLKVWQRAGRFDPDRASPVTWLCTIARNGAIDWYRANQRADQAMPATSADATGVSDDRPTAPERMEADEGEARLTACLDALGGQPQQAIRSAFFDGHSHAQLAVRMGVPLGTMKSWIRRGLAQLKACLADG